MRMRKIAQQVRLLRVYELPFVRRASEIVHGDEWISSSNLTSDAWLFNCRTLAVYKLEQPSVSHSCHLRIFPEPILVGDNW